ncbi:flagellar hook-associated protein FlgL [Methylomonas sp. MgM2]
MRISTSWNHQLGVNAILDQQAKLSETQMKLSTGKKILTPSEDPAAAVRLLDLDQVTKQTQQYQDNIVIARQRLSLEEANIQDVVDTLFRIKELTVQGLNDTNTQPDRAAIAAEIDQLKEHLLGIANTKNANGEYIFAGYATDTQPYAKGPAFDSTVVPGSPVDSYPYFGDNNQRSLQIGPSRFITDGNYGEQVFGASDVLPTDTAPLDPANAQSPKNLFEIVSKLSVSLTDNNPQDISLTELDTALERVVSVQTTIGARINALDGQENTNDGYILDMQSLTSEIGDLDYADAISKFNLQNVSLQAAQQAFTRVQNLSLFNYL